jgi:hypothetical protein
MWETIIAGAGGLMGLYVALRREIRRSYELLDKDISHVDSRLSQQVGHLDEGVKEVRADIRRLDGKIDAVRGELIGFLGSR